MTINEEIKHLKQQIEILNTKVSTLSQNLENKVFTPYSKSGSGRHNAQNTPVDPFTGLGGTKGGALAWNDSELKSPPLNQQPAIPTKGYHKHGHSRYAGGALDISTLELVEYETDENGNILDTEGNILNKHCQQYWANNAKIKTVEVKTDDGESSEFIPKIGNLEIEFDTTSGKWVAGSRYIDVEETYLIRRNSETGETMLDENETEMISPLYNEDPLKSSVVWDSTDKVWRFYAVYSPEPE